MTAQLLPGEWADQAACKGHTDLFYSDTEDPSFYDAAKRICERCPVMIQCGDWAITHHELFGVWGGMTPKQRRTIRRRRIAAGEVFPMRPKVVHAGPSGAAQCGTSSGYAKHRRDHTPICDDCREARNEEIRFYRQSA